MHILLKALFIYGIFGFSIFGQTKSSPGNNKGEQPMKRVTGIGGIFFKSKNPDSLRAWYKKHLGIEIESWGGFVFKCDSENNSENNGTTVWNIFNSDTKYFNPSNSTFMINYRVENLHELLNLLRSENCEVDPNVEESEFGKFGWVIDPEGNKIELWEPPKGE